jgi:ketosteroid isomerase-like protein
LFAAARGAPGSTLILSMRERKPMSRSSDHADSTDWQRQIADLQEDGRKAFQARDIARLRQIFADELIVNSPIHRVHDKNTVLDLLERGVIGHSSSVEHIEAVRRHDDLVTVMGYDVVTSPPGEEPVHRRFTNVWRARGGTWQLLIRHATPFEKS